jgi:hypothetical protein
VGGEAVRTFTVGTTPDETPPTWSGAYGVREGPGGSRLVLEGLVDDRFTGSGIAVFGLPVGDAPTLDPFVDAAPIFFPLADTCWDAGSGGSVVGRAFDLTFVDSAGNASEPMRVDLRAPSPEEEPGLGCSVTPGGAGWSLLAAMAVRRKYSSARR